MGKLLVIDGLDGSGKATQTGILVNKFFEKGLKVKQVDYPNYDSESSALVRFYLNGGLSDNVFDVNCYAASSFFACDHYISYLKNWKHNYDLGEIIVANRYVTSNAIHQMAKLSEIEWNDFLNWLFDFEFERMGLPYYDNLIYLDLLPEISVQFIQKRSINLKQKIDLHEQDLNYLNRCRKAAFYCVRKYGWQVVECFLNSEPLPVSYVSKKIEILVQEFGF